jgi:hypothetical protein
MSTKAQFAVYDEAGRIARLEAVRPVSDEKAVRLEAPVRVLLADLLERVARLEAQARSDPASR